MLAWPISSFGGVSGVIKNLLREFHGAGNLSPLAIEVSEPAQDSLPPAAGQPWPLERVGSISTWNPARPWRSIFSFCVKSPLILWKLRALCRRHSIDVLNPHFIGLEYFPLIVMRKLGIFRGKVILSVHGADIRGMMQAKGLERRLSRMLLRGADMLVACSGGLRDEILLFAPECKPRTVAVHNGIDVDAFVALAPEPFPLPESLAGRKVILNVGTYEYKKGHDILLQAFVHLKARHPEAALVIAGARSSSAVAQLAREQGIQDDVLLLENLPHTQIAALMKRADIFVLSSRLEPFGLVLLEAAAACKPIVASDTVGPRELIRHGEMGLIVPVDDPKALGEAISDLLDNPEFAAQVAARFHEHVRQHFTWKRTAARYEELVALLFSGQPEERAEGAARLEAH